MKLQGREDFKPGNNIKSTTSPKDKWIGGFYKDPSHPSQGGPKSIFHRKFMSTQGGGGSFNSSRKPNVSSTEEKSGEADVMAQKVMKTDISKKRRKTSIISDPDGPAFMAVGGSNSTEATPVIPKPQKKAAAYLSIADDRKPEVTYFTSKHKYISQAAAGGGKADLMKQKLPPTPGALQHPQTSHMARRINLQTESSGTLAVRKSQQFISSTADPASGTILQSKPPLSKQMSQESFTKSPIALSNVDELAMANFKPIKLSGSKKKQYDGSLPPKGSGAGAPSSQKENVPKQKVISLPKINHEEAMKKLTTIMNNNRSAKQSDDKLGGLRIQTKPKFHPSRMKSTTEHLLVENLPKPENGFVPGQLTDKNEKAGADYPRKHKSGFEPGVVKELEQSRSFAVVKNGLAGLPKGRNVGISQKTSSSLSEVQNLPKKTSNTLPFKPPVVPLAPSINTTQKKPSPPRRLESRESINRSLTKGKKNSIKATSFLPPDSFGKNRLNSVEKESLWSSKGGSNQFMSFGKHLMKKLQKKLSLGSNDSKLSSHNKDPAKEESLQAQEQSGSGAAEIRNPTSLGKEAVVDDYESQSSVVGARPPAINPDCRTVVAGEVPSSPITPTSPKDGLSATGTSAAITYEIISARENLQEQQKRESFKMEEILQEKRRLSKVIKSIKNFQLQQQQSQAPLLSSRKRAQDRGANCCGGSHAFVDKEPSDRIADLAEMEKLYEDLEARERMILDGQEAERLRIFQMEEANINRMLEEQERVRQEKLAREAEEARLRAEDLARQQQLEAEQEAERLRLEAEERDRLLREEQARLEALKRQSDAATREVEIQKLAEEKAKQLELEEIERQKQEKMKAVLSRWRVILEKGREEHRRQEQQFAVRAVSFLRFKVQWRIRKLVRTYRRNKAERLRLQKARHLTQAAGMTHETMGCLFGIRRMEQRHQQKMKNLLKLQATARALIAMGRLHRSKLAAKKIQAAWRMVLQRKKYRSLKLASATVQFHLRGYLDRRRALKTIRGVTKVQGLFRMRKARAEFKIKQEANQEYQKRMKLQEARNRIVQARERKQAVKKIETWRYRQLHLRELKVLRKYLARLPYECRGVYFKFMDVKKSTNELVHSYMHFIGNNKEMAAELNLKYADC